MRLALKRISGKKFGMVLAAALMVPLGGCTGDDAPHGFIDPTAVGRWKHQPLVVPVLDKLDVGIEEPRLEFTQAEDVKPRDLIAAQGDYRVGKNDLVSVSVSDLVGNGVETVKTARVSESGTISLPLIGQVHAAGLTEAELERAVSQAYKDANLIQNAQVTATVVEARNRTFSALGAVGRPGQYQILASDFRLLDALVLMGDVAQGADYLYVIRDREADRPSTRPAEAMPSGPGSAPSNPDILEPKSEGPSVKSGAMARTSVERAPLMLVQNAGTDATKPSGDRVILLEGQPKVVTSDAAAPAAAPAGADTAPVPATPPAPEPPAAAPTPATPPVDAATPTPAPAPPMAPASAPMAGPGMPSAAPNQGFEFNGLSEPADRRVIRVPIDALKNGELKYNIVIRPTDMIVVPGPIVGEYYMGGHIGRVGVYSMTGRKITLKQAVISAGMFDQMAVPSRAEIIRRIGPDREVFARVDLDRIFSGLDSDVFLKPNDVVNVGTDIFAPFVAAIRGAFRITYGFGFLYDKNFSDQLNNGR